MQSKVKYSDILKRGLKETPTQCLLSISIAREFGLSLKPGRTQTCKQEYASAFDHRTMRGVDIVFVSCILLFRGVTNIIKLFNYLVI